MCLQGSSSETLVQYRRVSDTGQGSQGDVCVHFSVDAITWWVVLTWSASFFTAPSVDGFSLKGHVVAATMMSAGSPPRK